jgi:hypothetical protein
MAATFLKLLLFLGIALGALTGCDPALRMVFQNHTGQPIRLTTVYARPARPDTVVHQLLPPGQMTHYFGIGGWNDTVIHRLVRQHEKRWELARAGDTLRLEGPALVAFLRHCPRKGLAKSTLVVDLR